MASLGIDSFGMFRPFKGAIFYASVHGVGSLNLFQWVGGIIAICATSVTWFFLRKLLKSDSAATAGALLWLYHPLNVVIFNWGSALNIGLYYTFSLASLLAIDCSLDSKSTCRRSAYFVAGACFFALSLLSYEMAFSLPFLLALYLGFYRREVVSLRSAVFLGATFLMIALLFLYVRNNVLVGAVGSIAANSAIMPSEAWQLSLASSVAYLEHLQLISFPFVGFELLIPFDPAGRLLEAAIGWFLIGALVLLALLVLKKAPFYLFGLLWSAIALAPILNVIPIWAGPIGDYYLPLSYLGWVVIGVSLFRNLTAIRPRESESLKRHLPAFAFCAVAVLIIAFGTESLSRQSLWRSEYTLFSAVAENTNRADAAHGVLASILLEQRKPEEALRSIERAMDIRSDPQYTSIWISILMNHTTMPPAKISELIDLALAGFPDSSELHATEGDFSMTRADLNKAEESYMAANALATTKSNKLNALTSLGIVSVEKGDLTRAVEYFQAAAELDPRKPSVLNNLKKALKDLRHEREGHIYLMKKPGDILVTTP